ncbi:hypothetical protein V2G26_000243 [Clonostachys chloroleuca]
MAYAVHERRAAGMALLGCLLGPVSISSIPGSGPLEAPTTQPDIDSVKIPTSSVTRRHHFGVPPDLETPCLPVRLCSRTPGPLDRYRSRTSRPHSKGMPEALVSFAGSVCPQGAMDSTRGSYSVRGIRQVGPGLERHMPFNPREKR